MNDNGESQSGSVARAASAAELARRLIDGDASAATIPEHERRAVAWALKDACYAAWSSEPRRAVLAAESLAALDRVFAEASPSASLAAPVRAALPAATSSFGTSACASGRATTDAAPRTEPEPATDISALAAWTDGIAQIAQGQMAGAAACFDRAHALFRTAGDGQHAAETQVPKIMALSMLGQHAEATACAQRTLDEFLRYGDRRAAAKVSLNLGALHVRRGAYAEAARYSREAAVLFARVGDHEHSVMADINTADALTAMGSFDEALRLFTRAGKRAGTHAFPVLRALVEESVGLLELARGNYRVALAGLEGSRRSYERLAMPQPLAIADKQLADAYFELRLLPEALVLFDNAVTRFRALDVPDEEAWALTQRGRVQALLAQPERALDSFERAAALFGAQENAVGSAAVQLARAELALAADHVAEAITLSGAAAQRFAAADLADGQARAEIVTAHALLRAGRIDEARTRFVATLARAREMQLLPVQFRASSGCGLAALAAGDRAAARAAFESAVELFEDQRRVLPGDELRSAFLADNLLPYRELLRLALEAHAQAPDGAHATAVLQWLERFRARTFSERLARAPDDDGDPQAQVLRSKLNWLYRRVRRAQEEGEHARDLVDALRSTERELLERVRRNRLMAHVHDEPDARADALDVARLIAGLGDGALVEYGVLDDELFACVVTAQGVSVLRALAPWSEVQAAVRSARFQLESLRHGAAPLAHHADTLNARVRKRLQQVFALIWAPLAEHLHGRRRIVVVPHGLLAQLPFGALFDGQRFLVESAEIAIAPSSRTALFGFERRAGALQRALVLGESSTLPHVEAEARFIGGLFDQANVCTGASATVATLRQLAPGADLIHFACHAQFRNDNPHFSALHLHDGSVTAEAVEALRLRPAVVVLNACETGVADGAKGDEMIGLARAFLVAGAARVVATLWPIDDAVAARFMTHFYGALRAGSAPSQALTMSQRTVMREFAHPFYWSGFALFGGW